MAVNNFNSSEKILKYIDKIDYFMNAHKTLVVTEFDLTNRCNNMCPLCCGNKENAAELTKEQVKSIIDGLSYLENKGIIFSGGGEPLISPQFEYAVRLAKMRGMSLGLNSNGLALDQEKSKIISEAFEYCRISLDAGTPKLYNLTHGMSEREFNIVLNNIREFSKIKRETNSPISFGTGFLTAKDTISEMEEFVKLSKELGCDFAQFRPFTGDNTDISDEYLRLKNKYEDRSFVVRCSLQKYLKIKEGKRRSYHKCHGMFFSTVITADAKMYACLHHRQDEKYLIGSLTDCDLVSLWKSYNKFKIYEDMDLSECPEFCRNDAFNATLQGLIEDTVHPEFL